MTDWERLGLQGPTDDLRAIKQAYARQLRSARPDDDADAYQALREAYERAQWYVRATVAAGEAGEAPQAVEVALPPSPPQPSPPSAADESTQLLAAYSAPDALQPSPTPASLCDQVVAWQAMGRDTLLAQLPALKQSLLDLPLSRHDEASVRFAELLLSRPALPHDLALMLDAHFGWLDDFRTERQLGPGAMQSLREIVGESTRPVTDAFVLQRHAELLAWHRLVDAGRWLRAIWLGSLLQPLLAGQLASPTGLLQRMGLPPAQQRRLGGLLRRVGWLDLAAVGVAVFLLAYAMGAGTMTPGATLERMASLGWVAFVAGMAVRTLQFLRTTVSMWCQLRLPMAQRLGPACTWIGLGLMAAGSGAMVLVEQGLWTADAASAAGWGLLAALLGGLLALPGGRAQAFVGIGACIYLAEGWHVSQPGSLALLATWVVAGQQAYLRGWVPLFDAQRWTGDKRYGWGIAATLLPSCYLAAVTRVAGVWLVLAGMALAATPYLAHAPISAFRVAFLPWVAVGGLLRLRGIGVRHARAAIQQSA